MTLPQQRATNALGRRMGVQESKTQGPTLGELYSQWNAGPGLRGLWYPGNFGDAGSWRDQSGNDRHLTANGTPTVGIYNDLIPYWEYDGATMYHARADEAGLDITGTEANIAASLRGLTLGGWFWLDTQADQMAMSKDAGGVQRSYYLFANNGSDFPEFLAFQTMAPVLSSVASTVSGNVNAWNFMVGRLVPGVSADIYVNGTKTSNTTSIITSIFNSTAEFDIGRFAAPGLYLNGRCALAFLAAAAWPDALINMLWNRSRSIFGV